MDCKYCKKTFVSKSVLIKHQKSAKYCLKIQNKDNKNSDFFYKCDYCKKEFTRKYLFEDHTDKCLEKYKSLVIKLEEKINKNESLINNKTDDIDNLKHQLDILQTKNDMLEKQLERSTTTVEEIAKQPKVQNTTTNNNKILIATPLDLSKQGVNQMIQNGFSHEYLTQGQKGVAKFAYDNMLKDDEGNLKYICTDPSRQIFQFKNEDGTVQKDVKATKLTKALLEGEIKRTSHKIAWDHMENAGDEEFMQYTNYYQDIQAMETDNSQFSKELSSLVV